jgi:hypothetical protein
MRSPQITKSMTSFLSPSCQRPAISAIEMPKGSAKLAFEAVNESIKLEMSRTITAEGVRNRGIWRSGWIEVGQVFALFQYALRLCLIGGVLLLAGAVGAAAIGSSLGFPPLPRPLATIDLHLPVIFRVHMMAGGGGLVLFPWVILLRRRKPVHRFVGRFALGLLCLGALAALPSALASEALPAAKLGFLTQGLLTLYFLTASFRAIRRGDRESHARGMLCVAAIMIGVVLLRIMLYCALHLELEFNIAYAAIAWISWGIPLTAMLLRNRMVRPQTVGCSKRS